MGIIVGIECTDYISLNLFFHLELGKRLYSIEEASVYLGRSVWAVREMLWAGKMPYVKDGRRILFDIFDMESWIESNKDRFDL